MYAPLCKTIFKIVGDKDTSEDIAQDSLYLVWEKRNEINISAKSYLYRMAINKSFNYLQRDKKFVKTQDCDLTEYELPVNDTEEKIDYLYTNELVNKAISSLPPACKAIFIMSRIDQMSYKEIGEALEISVKTVENQMLKALKVLREKLSMEIISLFIMLSFFLKYFN